MAATCPGVLKRSWNGVAITPGATALTRTRSLTSSLARPRVRLPTNALDEAYRPEPGPPPLLAAIELVLMITPP
jgi:hypothetical protein